MSFLVGSFLSEKVEPNDMKELGHFIFFEKKLSKNGTKSCASCHAPELAFTDGYRLSLGLEADVVQRNSPTLLNIAHYKSFNWANPDLKTLEQQFVQPIFRQHPPELGLSDADTSNVLAFINKNKKYQFFVTKKIVTWQILINSMSQYVNSLESKNSPYDRFHFQNDSTAMSLSAQKGEKLFFGEKLKCGVCHPAPDFTLATSDSNFFYNIGLYRDYPKNDNGLFEKTKHQKDKGKFRVPTLRNVAITAPYMHDGSVSDLSEVMDIFQHGGRNNPANKQIKDGNKHPNKSHLISGYALSKEEKANVIEFLYALTDTTFLRNDFFLNPFKEN